MSACGTGALTEQVGCAAAQGLVDAVVGAVRGLLLWLPHAVVRRGEMGPGTAVLLVLVTTVLAVRWTLTQNGPLSGDLRAAAALVRPYRKRWPRAWSYTRTVGRGVARLWPYARRAGGWAVRRAFHGRRGGLVVAGLLGYLSAGLVWSVVGSLPGPLPLVLLVVGLHRLGGAGQSAGREWWSERVLVAAMVSAGVLPPVRAGEARHVLRRRGQPQHDGHGTAVTFSLPGARTWADVLKARDRIAGALSLDVDTLFITHASGQPADVVTMQVVSSSRPAREPAVASAMRTDWSRPVVLGLAAQGREVLFTTTETHTVIAGATGSGKTALARAVVAHAALDPRVAIYGVDGKGDAGSRGWQALEPRCEQFVRGMGPDSPARVEALLTEVSDLAQQRGAAGQEAPEVLLILEEWATARTVLRRLDPAVAERCDALVTVLLATARSRGVHVLLIVQRGTATAFPVDQRANCGQRLVGKFGDSAEAGYVLESLPPRLPSRAGEFAVSLDGKAASLVMVDYLEPAGWTTLCTRAAAQRPAPAAAAVSMVKTPPAAPSPEPVVPEHDPPLDPLLDAVVEVLRDADPAGMTASALHTALPEWVRPDTPARLGMALRPHLASAVTIRRGYVGKAAVIRLGVPGTGPRQVPGASPANPRRVPGPGAPGTSSPPAHAHSGPAVLRSPESPAGAR